MLDFSVYFALNNDCNILAGL